MLYNPLYSVWGITPTIIILFFVICIWESVWKGIGLWKSGKQKQFAWFICIFIFNTLGILPIIYLLFFQKNKERVHHAKAKQKPARKKK